MGALAVDVVLTLDAEADCLCVGRDGDRQVVVWPFGYSAVSGDPAVVYDPAGNEVARTGAPFDLGGGGADINLVDPSERCGADSAWQAGGPTRFEIETASPQTVFRVGGRVIARTCVVRRSPASRISTHWGEASYPPVE